MKTLTINGTEYHYKKTQRTLFLTKKEERLAFAGVVCNKHKEYIFTSISYSKGGTRYFYYLDSLNEKDFGLEDMPYSRREEIAETIFNEVM